jgi:hypothetical protein
VWAVIQDHVNSNLIFAGTEWGLFFTVDGGTHWAQLKGGMPTAQIRDMTVQKRENDLVLATFGRGFYVLDDYSALREITAQALAQEAELFPLRQAYRFDMLGQQEAVWGNATTPNPPYGAVFTYSTSPGFSGNLVLTMSDENGKDLCRIDVPRAQGGGVQRVVWSLRVAQAGQQAGGGRGGGGFGRGGGGGGPACVAIQPPAAANASAEAAPAGGAQGGGGFGGRGGGAPQQVPVGRYTAKLGKKDGDTVTAIGKAQSFLVVPLPAKNW